MMESSGKIYCFAVPSELNIEQLVSRAVTQYYRACFVPDLAKQKEVVEKRIRGFFSSVKQLLTIEHFVIDFAVTADRVFAVEL